MSEENKAPAALAAGSTAPDFTLPARSGKSISLHDFAGQKDVLIYFYPKDDTPGCTRESCSLRDGWADLGKAGVEVLGISRDDAASHNAFAAKYNLPFELLTDADHAVHEKYGAWGQNPNPAWGVGPLRKSFLVGKDGRVKHVFEKVDTEHHADQVLRAAGFTPAPKPAPAPVPAVAPAVAPAPKPAAPAPPSVPPAPPAPKPPAPAAAAPAPKPAAPPAPKPAAPKPAAPKAAPKKAAAAKKAVKKAVKKVVRKARKAVVKAKVKKAVRKVKKAAPKKKTAKRTARRTARKAVRKVKRTVRKVKRVVRKAKKAAPKRKAHKAAKRKKR